MRKKENRSEEPTRYRVARNDASVSSITSAVEDIFGLPEGSVKLVRPDGTKKRADATIRSLRDEWE